MKAARGWPAPPYACGTTLSRDTECFNRLQRPSPVGETLRLRFCGRRIMSAAIKVLAGLLFLALAVSRISGRRSVRRGSKSGSRPALGTARLMQQPWDVPERRGDR